MYCTACGNNNSDNAQFCTHCGARLASGMQQPMAAPPIKAKSTNVVAIVIIAVVGVTLFMIAVLAAILFPVFSRARYAAMQESCHYNIKALGTAVDLYSNDWDNAYPPASKWCDSLGAYVKDPMWYKCPAVQNLRCGFGFNSNLTKQSQAPVPYLVLLYEADGGWNASGGPEAMITQPRHLGRSILFIDNHVSRLMGNDTSQLKWTTTGP